MAGELVCHEVRPIAENGEACVLITSQDDRGTAVELPTLESLNAGELKKGLRSSGIVLGGPLQLATTRLRWIWATPACEIVACDGTSEEYRLSVDRMEEYHLSVGSKLYCFQVAKPPSICSWLEGKTLEMRELANGTLPADKELRAR
jgi:hypothetical protein